MTLRYALAALLVSPVAACGDDAEPADQTVTYTGALASGVTQDPIAGAEICFVSHPEIGCVTTSATGGYSVTLPAEARVEVEVEADGFISIAANFITRDADLNLSAFMFREAEVQLGLGELAEVDLTLGGLLVRVYDPANGTTGGVAGVTIDVDPSDGDGPFYANGLVFDGSATATAAGGNAIFLGLEEKTYRVSFESETQDCLGTYLWKSSDGRLEAKIKPGFATYMYVDCPAK